MKNLRNVAVVILGLCVVWIVRAGQSQDPGSISSRLKTSSVTARVEHVRQSTGSILTGVRADVICTWPAAFADANYSMFASVEDTSALGLGLNAERVRSKTASAATVQVLNASLGTLSGTVDCLGVHD
jgi:hypothetical protein